MYHEGGKINWIYKRFVGKFNLTDQLKNGHRQEGNIN